MLRAQEMSNEKEMQAKRPENGEVKMEDPDGEQGSGKMEESAEIPASYRKQKDRTLREFLNMMDDYAPIIPDAVTDYYLSIAGFECDDIRIKRLLALAAQKFIADIAQDAYQYSCIRSSSMMSAVLSNQSGYTGSIKNRYGRGKTVLTMEDLSAALHEYGINMKQPDFYR